MKYLELELVDLSQAKILKELGFPQGWEANCMFYSCESEGEYGFLEGDIVSYNSVLKNALDAVAAPSLELVIKWLRETHNVLIYSKPYEFDTNGKTVTWFLEMWFGDNFEEYYDAKYTTYEDVLFAGINNALATLNMKFLLSDKTKEIIQKDTGKTILEIINTLLDPCQA